MRIRAREGAKHGKQEGGGARSQKKHQMLIAEGTQAWNPGRIRSTL
jgi:hypothetical protein